MPDPILVTGATGFVGSAVARAFAGRGLDVRVLARPGSDRRNLAGFPNTIIEGDLTDPASLARAVAGCRYLAHVAADYRIWVPDPAVMHRANVTGTTALMAAARNAGVERIVYCSSVAALGNIGDGTPGDESTPVTRDSLVGIYKRSKYDAEQAVLAMVADGLPAVIVNPAAPIGPRDIKPTPTGKVIIDAASGRMPAYIDTGLCVVHVDDVAEGHALALERGRIGARYVLGGDNLTLAQLLGLVADIAGRAPPRIRLPIPLLWPVAIACEALARITGMEPPVIRDHLRMARKKMFFSSACAVSELGYAPRPARAAVADAIAWFRANGMVRA